MVDLDVFRDELIGHPVPISIMIIQHKSLDLLPETQEGRRGGKHGPLAMEGMLLGILPDSFFDTFLLIFHTVYRIIK